MFLKEYNLILCSILIAGVCSEVLLGDLKVNLSDENSRAAQYYNFTVNLEEGFKKVVKGGVRQLLPYMVRFNEVANISHGCTKSLVKYLNGLERAKVWAVKMFDATSKLMPGLMVGTFSDYGAYDECLEVQAPPGRNKDDGFRGSSCSVQFKPPYPARSPSFTIVKGKLGNDNDTLGAFFRVSYETLHHKWFRVVACVPSKCSLQDMQLIAQKISNMTGFDVRIPKCYVKEDTVLQSVHVAVLICLGVLLTVCLIGTVVDKQSQQQNRTDTAVINKVLWKKIFVAFSFSTNFSRLLAPSGGANELKCVYGLRALSMCWIILGHSYVMLNFDLLKSQKNMKNWFETWQWEFIGNGWLAVEPFFLISGVLVSYGGLKSKKKLMGFKSVPLMALRRYYRLTPPLLMMMGLVFFVPFVSSGPFWYEQMDAPIESCRQYWWSTLLYISNWLGIDKGCTVPTWYLAADFQLHIFSLVMLIIVVRYVKVGLSVLVVCIALSCAAVGIQTIRYDLLSNAQLATADDVKINKVLNEVHIFTLTHLGPYCVGMVLGYFIHKYKEHKIKKWILVFGWCFSVVLSLSTVLGGHRFATGDETSRSIGVLYASVHRTVFVVGVAWVIFACITGNGGPVNSLLSSSILVPLSRLTFMAYLLHPLVVWTRLGSLRERPVAWHYDFVYSWLANLMTTFALTVPFYLLVEAPLSNVDRIIFSRNQESQDKNKKEEYNLSQEKTTWNSSKHLEDENNQTIVRTPL